VIGQFINLKFTVPIVDETYPGFHKTHLSAFVYSSYHIYCNKMCAYALFFTEFQS